MDWDVIGVDVSRYQGAMDWERAYLEGVRFAAIRATVGDYYTDPNFNKNWIRARAAGIAVSAYHVVAPADSAGRRISAEKQIGLFASVLDGRRADFSLVLDCELTRGCSVSEITKTIQFCAANVILLDERNPMMYTRATWWDVNVARNEGWSDFELWVAHYNAWVDAPDLPKDWSTWRLWQWSADGNNQGATYGASSRDIDLDRFNGSEKDFNRWIGVSDPEPEPEPVAGCVFEVMVPTLNVRDGPGIQYRDVGNLYNGERVEAVDVSGQDVWVEIQPGRWAAAMYNGRRYMRLVK